MSARASHETFTTSVYTDRQGNYSFPPLSAGQYSMWAQAKGFDVGKADVQPDQWRPCRAQPDAAAADRSEGDRAAARWARMVCRVCRKATNQDRRMKHLLRNNCTACHGPAVRACTPVRCARMGEHHRRDGPAPADQARWRRESGVAGLQAGARRISRPRHQGPAAETGAASVGRRHPVVFTEYDIPRQGRPISAHTGTIWTEGQSTRYESKGARDIWVDSKGYLWVSDDRSIGRTTGRLDPRTGKWTDYALPNAKGIAITHTAYGATRTTTSIRAASRTAPSSCSTRRRKSSSTSPRPDNIPRAGGHIDVDSQGNAWTPADGGAMKLDGKTGRVHVLPGAIR